jgi:hypothetical protein
LDFQVTGANKGIGYGIVRGLAAQLPNEGNLIYLTGQSINVPVHTRDGIKWIFLKAKIFYL